MRNVIGRRDEQTLKIPYLYDHLAGSLVFEERNVTLGQHRRVELIHPKVTNVNLYMMVYAQS